MTIRTAAFAVALALVSAGCTDRQALLPTPDQPSAEQISSKQIQVLENGEIHGLVDLPYDFDPQYPQEWTMWGRFPAHEEIWIPEGVYEVEFEVIGGARFFPKPDAPASIDEGFRISSVQLGPGGGGRERATEPAWPPLRVIFGYVHDEFEGQPYPPLNKWQAPSYSLDPSGGRVKVVGPGRIRFNRHYNGSYLQFMLGLNHGGHPMSYYDVAADQKVRFIARPLGGSMKLDCTPNPVFRGDPITCRAETESPGGPLAITGWSFDGVPRTDGDPTSAEWKGIMVKGGTVTVRARIAGQEESKSAAVVVTPRDWSNRAIPSDVSEASAADLPARPTRIQDLGDIHHNLLLAVSRDKWEPILSGPNANLAYLVDLPVSYSGTIHVNRTALAVGSDFWSAQPTRQRSGGVVDCLRREEDVLGFIPVILRHEGQGFDPKSHAFLFVEEVKRVGNSGFEAVIGASLGELADRAEAILKEAGEAAEIAAEIADAPGYRPTWCRFKFNYSGR